MQTTLIDPADLSRLVQFFDILAAVVFAVSGALVASRKGMDVMGFMWLAVITGVGGGTVRDLILDVPVFWVQNPVYVSACLATAVVMHFVAPRVESAIERSCGSTRSVSPWSRSPGTSRLWMSARQRWWPSRWARSRDRSAESFAIRWDTCRRSFFAMRSTSRRSVLGACTFVGLNGLGLARVTAMTAGFFVTFGVRGLAIRYRLVVAGLPRIGDARALEERTQGLGGG